MVFIGIQNQIELIFPNKNVMKKIVLIFHIYIEINRTF